MLGFETILSLPFHNDSHGEQDRPEDGLAVLPQTLEESLRMLVVCGLFRIEDGGVAQLLLQLLVSHFLGAASLHESSHKDFLRCQLLRTEEVAWRVVALEALDAYLGVGGILYSNTPFRLHRAFGRG